MSEITFDLSTDRFIDMKTICHITGMTDKWFYKLIQDGAFPPPIKFGRSSKWIEREVLEWFQERIQSSRK
ncbi:helix-turn-helix transcriptional regulator [Pseudocitrobacter cyperus]|uniref:AlpA family transcriptional regulator n=1 Tax=Pseudocitrobacter cyperus TaxID=3112843 RepID=A0ABV0HM63_9ENTR